MEVQLSSSPGVWFSFASGPRCRGRLFVCQRLTELFQSRVKVGRFSEINEAIVTLMRSQNFVRMLDRAEILLGSRRDLSYIGQKYSCVRAIFAMETLHEI